MDKLLFKIILLLFAIQGNAQIFSRKIDIAAQMNTPNHLEFFYTPTILNYSFYVINNGPDTLMPEDSIRYRVIGNHPQEQPYRFYRITKFVNPGDSLLITDTFYIDSTKSNNFLFGVRAFAIKSSAASSRPIISEFTNTHYDNQTSINLRLNTTLNSEKLNTTNHLRIYPNPSQEKKIVIESFFTFKSVRIFDNSGRMVQQFNKLEQKNKVLNLESLCSGIYQVIIEFEDQLIIKKLILL